MAVRRFTSVRGLASLAVLALLAVTLHSLVFSTASFTDQDGASASFTAGSVSHTNTAAGSFVLDASYLRPGMSKQGTLTITGGPDIPAAYTLSRVSLVDTPASPALSDALQLTVEDLTTAATLYDGVASGFTAVPLGVIADGESHEYGFTLTYPTVAAQSELLGASMQLQLEFVGVSQ